MKQNKTKNVHSKEGKKIKKLEVEEFDHRTLSLVTRLHCMPIELCSLWQFTSVAMSISTIYLNQIILFKPISKLDIF